MEDCIFCSIANKTANADILFEDDLVIVIRDIMPKAPVHFLVLSKEHITSVNELQPTHSELITRVVLTAKTQAAAQGVAESGYKLVWNVGKDGGQIVPHLHLHVLGGKALGE